MHNLIQLNKNINNLNLGKSYIKKLIETTESISSRDLRQKGKILI